VTSAAEDRVGQLYIGGRWVTAESAAKAYTEPKALYRPVPA
jgi:hypothetical protein